MRMPFAVSCVLVSLAMGGTAMADAGLAAEIDCSGSVTPQPLPVRPSAVPAVAFELQGVGGQHGAPRGALATYSDERQSADRVLARLRDQHCNPVVADPGAGYVKQTEFDNTPYRFNANSGFTAAEFDAWMKERGIRIVNGRAVVGGRPQAAEAQPVSVSTDLQCAQAAAGEEVAASC